MPLAFVERANRQRDEQRRRSCDVDHRHHDTGIRTTPSGIVRRAFFTSLPTKDVSSKPEKAKHSADHRLIGRRACLHAEADSPARSWSPNRPWRAPPCPRRSAGRRESSSNTAEDLQPPAGAEAQQSQAKAERQAPRTKIVEKVGCRRAAPPRGRTRRAGWRRRRAAATESRTGCSPTRTSRR